MIESDKNDKGATWKIEANPSSKNVEGQVKLRVKYRERTSITNLNISGDLYMGLTNPTPENVLEEFVRIYKDQLKDAKVEDFIIKDITNLKDAFTKQTFQITSKEESGRIINTKFEIKVISGKSIDISHLQNPIYLGDKSINEENIVKTFLQMNKSSLNGATSNNLSASSIDESNNLWAINTNPNAQNKVNGEAILRVYEGGFINPKTTFKGVSLNESIYALNWYIRSFEQFPIPKTIDGKINVIDDNHLFSANKSNWQIIKQVGVMSINPKFTGSGIEGLLQLVLDIVNSNTDDDSYANFRTLKILFQPDTDSNMDKDNKTHNWYLDKLEISAKINPIGRLKISGSYSQKNESELLPVLQPIINGLVSKIIRDMLPEALNGIINKFVDFETITNTIVSLFSGLLANNNIKGLISDFANERNFKKVSIWVPGTINTEDVKNILKPIQERIQSFINSDQSSILVNPLSNLHKSSMKDFLNKSVIKIRPDYEQDFANMGDLLTHIIKLVASLPDLSDKLTGITSMMSRHELYCNRILEYNSEEKQNGYLIGNSIGNTKIPWIDLLGWEPSENKPATDIAIAFALLNPDYNGYWIQEVKDGKKLKKYKASEAGKRILGLTNNMQSFLPNTLLHEISKLWEGSFGSVLTSTLGIISDYLSEKEASYGKEIKRQLLPFVNEEKYQIHDVSYNYFENTLENIENKLYTEISYRIMFVDKDNDIDNSYLVELISPKNNGLYKLKSFSVIK